MQVTVYGAGYVGLVTAVCLAEIGHDVLCIDIDSKKITDLHNGILPIYEADLENLLHTNQQQKRIQFTMDQQAAVAFGNIHMIAVGTPSRANGSVNLDYVDAIAHTIGQYRTTDCIVVNKSTVPPGTAERVDNIINATAAKFANNFMVTVVSNPEFLQEGTAVNQCMHPDRILIGTTSMAAAELMRHFYQPLLLEHPERFLIMNPRSAELTKYAANALLATKISFINEISQIAECVGADIQEIKCGMALDYRINPAFLNVGCGFGGSCFPKDLAGLKCIAQDHQFNPIMISAVIQRNYEQQQLLFKKLNIFFQNKLQNKTIALWGLAFKPHTDDIRNASSQALIDALLAAGTIIQAYDPLAMPATKAHYADKLEQLHFADSALAALQQADALVLVTEWPQFQEHALTTIYQYLKAPVIFDGRNIFDPLEASKLGFHYFGIGRAT